MCRNQYFSRPICLAPWIAIISFALPGCKGCAVPSQAPRLVERESDFDSPQKDTLQESTSVVIEQSPPEYQPLERHSSPPTSDTAREQTGYDRNASTESDSPNGNRSPDQTDSPEPVRGKRKSGDVNSTLKQIQTLRQNAKRAKDEGDVGKAFQHVTKAWDAARSYPDDAQCRAIVKELAAEIRDLGPNANAPFRVQSAHSELIVK